LGSSIGENIGDDSITINITENITINDTLTLYDGRGHAEKRRTVVSELRRLCESQRYHRQALRLGRPSDKGGIYGDIRKRLA
jgi:hypothetical protein